MNQCIFKQYKKEISFKNYSDFVLGADIGGTNSSFAVAGIIKSKDSQEKVELLYSLHFQSQKVTSIVPIIKQIISCQIICID